jgi:uncharacterized membrane protein YgcG
VKIRCLPLPGPRRLVARAVSAAFLTVAIAGSALGADIPRLATSITDRTGSIEDAATVQGAIDSLLDRYNIQLFVLFVPTTDELNAPEFASETAAQNSLGANDALLLVAIQDRSEAIWVADGLDEISDEEIDGILADVLEPRLADGQFDEAVIDTAEALGRAVTLSAPTEPPVATQVPATTPRPGAGGTTDSDGEGGVSGLAILVGFLLIGGLAVVLMFGNRWLTVRREAEERDRRTGKLAREANGLLVETDERIRTAQQEIGYVEAAYGAEETAPLRTAVGEAQTEMRAAFEIRQRLDDAEPEDPPAREAMLTEIVERTRRGQAALDREADRIRQLRDLERDAPTVLKEVVPRIETIEARLPAAESATAELANIAPAAAASVRGNLAEARKGVTGARAAVEAGIAALGRSDRRTAAKQARTAIVGADGAGVLVDAIDKLLASVREAAARVPHELAAAEAALAEAQEAGTAATGATAIGSSNRSQVDAADQALRVARAAAVAGDPIAALKAATEARSTSDAAVAAIRRAAIERSRLLATADASLAAAVADIDRAANFIATRRTGVGRIARTRLAEAERHFEHASAVRDTDPDTAIASARRAEQLAEQAYSLADRDFTDWDGGGPGTGTPGGRGGSDAMGAILGGILGGILSGGGRGGGWGGSPWGSQGPFGGGGGWGGGDGGGGGPFSGGGGFGGGGGRSRGGRW